MLKSITIALNQINNRVADLIGNSALISRHCKEQQNYDLILFPEMSISGYPCQDLWHRHHFVNQSWQQIQQIQSFIGSNSCVMVGSPQLNGNKVYNSIALIDNQQIKKVFNKKSLPNTGVFHEKRHFTPANTISYFSLQGFYFAVLICEDFWQKSNWLLLAEQDVDAVIVLNSSPYSFEKQNKRQNLAKNLVEILKKPLIYLNQVGGEDGLVFDGNSFVFDGEGNKILQMSSFACDFAVIKLDNNGKITIDKHPAGKYIECNLANQYTATVLATRDYVAKKNFTKVVIGLSGGIDSALVANIAVDALGSNNVSAIALPTNFNSSQSFIDAKNCADNLNISLQTINIEPIFQQFLSSLKQQNLSQLATENLQARIRGNILMSISNSTGALLLSTGNKSELACGYTTLYGDMCGAFNPIYDFYKTTVYKLATWRNANNCPISDFIVVNAIPNNIINKEPTAELRPNQKDSDSLPPYPVLDAILHELIEQKKSPQQIKGFDEQLVRKVAQMLCNSEFKRKQASTGTKVSEAAFNLDWIYPTKIFWQ